MLGFSQEKNNLKSEWHDELNIESKNTKERERRRVVEGGAGLRETLG